MPAIRIRTSTGWQDLAIQGAQGPQGPTGPQGIQGATGAQGPTGSIAGSAAGGDLAGTYPNPTLAVHEAWITATLAQGSHFAAPYGPVQYRKRRDGSVELRGLWTVGVAGTIFTLPAGYRPVSTYILIFACITGAAGGVSADVRVDGSTGNVTWSTSGGTWISLSNVQFNVN